MKKRILIILALLILIILTIEITVRRNNNEEAGTLKQDIFEFNISKEFFEDFDKYMKSKSTGDIQYTKKQAPLQIERIMISCTIANKIDNNGKEISYLRLPSWAIRYTDINNQNIEIKDNYANDTKVILELKNIEVNIDNQWKVGEYYIYEQPDGVTTTRMDFLNTYLQENK